MRRLYSYMIDITNLAMIYFLAVTFPLVIFLYTKRPVENAVFLWMAILILLSYLCNIFVHHLAIFLAVHLFMTVIPFLVHLPQITLIFSFLLVLELWIQDIVLWTHRLDKRTINWSAGFVVLIVFVYFYSASKHRPSVNSFSYYAGLTYTVCYILRLYLLNLKRIPNDENNGDNAGAADIIHCNNKYVFTIVGGLFVFNIFIHLPFVEALFHQIVTWIGSFIKWLLSLMFQEVDKKEEAVVAITPTPEPVRADPFIVDQDGPSAIASILEKIMSFLVLAGLVIVLSVLIFQLIKHIFKNYRTRAKGSYIKDSRGKPIETKEKIKTVKSKKRHHFTLLTSINEKIRQKYAHKINHMQTLGYQIKTTHTPNERADDIETKLSENITELTDYYNKARYSNQKLTNKDWQKVKELF